MRKFLLGIGLLILACGGSMPAQAGPFVPNPDQRITVLVPAAGLSIPVDGAVPVSYGTDDGKEAIAYLDGWMRGGAKNGAKIIFQNGLNE